MFPKIAKCIGLSLAAGSLFGCANQINYTKVGLLLDPVDSSVNEWGKVTVSDLVLLPNKGQFKIDYSTNTAFYIEKARQDVEGTARSSIESALQVALALKGGFQPGISVGKPPREANNAPSATLSSPTGTASEALSSKSFTPVSPQYNGALVLRERLALAAGVNDKLSELALAMLANPKELPKNKKVYFGVLQVTCQPGSRTRKGYIGDANISLEFARARVILLEPRQPVSGQPSQDPVISSSPAETNESGTVNVPASTEAVRQRNQPSSVSAASAPLPRQNERITVDKIHASIVSSGSDFEFSGDSSDFQPSSFAVLPLMDSQRLDLRSSLRDQKEFVLALAAAFAAQGLSAEASFLLDYVKRKEADMSTRSSVPTITTYADGKSFGFQIYPAFQALEDPARAYSKSANVLQPMSFPAVVVMLLDTEDLKRDGGKWTDLAVHVRSRWIPIEGGATLSPSRRIELAERLASAKSILDKAKNEEKNQAYYEARRELRALASLGAGITRVSPLPNELTTPAAAPTPTPPPTLSAVPANLHGWVNAPTALTFTGSNFMEKDQSIIKAVTLGGIICESYVHNEDTVVVVIPGNRFPSGAITLPLSVITSVGSASRDISVTFDLQAPVDGRDKPAFTIKRDSQGKFVGLEVVDPGSLTAVQLMEAIKEILLTTDKPAKVINTINE